LLHVTIEPEAEQEIIVKVRLQNDKKIFIKKKLF